MIKRSLWSRRISKSSLPLGRWKQPQGERLGEREGWIPAPFRRSHLAPLNNVSWLRKVLPLGFSAVSKRSASLFPGSVSRVKKLNLLTEISSVRIFGNICSSLICREDCIFLLC